MIIEKNDYDKNYPYTIIGGWGDKVYCDENDLKKLKKQIEKILKENEKKD